MHTNAPPFFYPPTNHMFFVLINIKERVEIIKLNLRFLPMIDGGILRQQSEYAIIKPEKIKTDTNIRKTI
jgi:hypothetical protein